MSTIPTILLTMSVLSLGLSTIYLIQARKRLNKIQDIYDNYAQKQKEIREKLDTYINCIQRQKELREELNSMKGSK